MARYRHLNSEDRSHIETDLNNRQSFKEIVEKVGKDCSTISKEIRSHMVFRKTGAYGRPFRIRCTVARGEKMELSVAIQVKVEVTHSNWNFRFQPTPTLPAQPDFPCRAARFLRTRKSKSRARLSPLPVAPSKNALSV